MKSNGKSWLHRTLDITVTSKRRRSIGFLVALVFFGPAMSGQTTETPKQPPSRVVNTPHTTIVVIGALHNFHMKNPYYSKEILRDILVACRPSEILVELPPTMHDKPTVVNGRLANGFDEANEGWAEQAAAKKLGVPVFPFDINRREEVRQENGYYRRREQASKDFAAWLQQRADDSPLVALKAIQQFRSDIKESIICFANKARPELINSEAFDSIIRANWRINDIVSPELMKAHPEKAELTKERAWLGEQWHVRNRTMIEKIMSRATAHPGKRLAVVTGAEHRYILRDLLRREDVVLKEYWELP